MPFLFSAVGRLFGSDPDNPPQNGCCSAVQMALSEARSLCPKVIDVATAKAKRDDRVRSFKRSLLAVGWDAEMAEKLEDEEPRVKESKREILEILR